MSTPARWRFLPVGILIVLAAVAVLPAVAGDERWAGRIGQAVLSDASPAAGVDQQVPADTPNVAGVAKEKAGDTPRAAGVAKVMAGDTSASARPAQAAVVSDPAAARTLVELVRLDSTIRLDIKYATSDNFMGRQMYAQARAFLQRPAAEALVRAHRSLKKQGFGVLVFDGYRPWAVTKKFWDETPAVQRKFVANPWKGSKHNRGCAVDLTLIDLKTGQEVSMPSPYDDFSDKASSTFRGGTAEQRRLRAVLRAAMEKQGFRVEPSEWWHFDYKDWRKYPLLDIPFEKLPPR